MTQTAIAERLVKAGPKGPLPPDVAALLRARNAHLVSETPDLVAASEAFRLWSTRLKNTGLTKAPLEGVQRLLKELLLLPPDEEIFHFSYVARDLAASLFFERGAGKFLGYALLDKKKAVAAA